MANGKQGSVEYKIPGNYGEIWTEASVPRISIKIVLMKAFTFVYNHLRKLDWILWITTVLTCPGRPLIFAFKILYGTRFYEKKIKANNALFLLFYKMAGHWYSRQKLFFFFFFNPREMWKQFSSYFNLCTPAFISYSQIRSCERNIEYRTFKGSTQKTKLHFF